MKMFVERVIYPLERKEGISGSLHHLFPTLLAQPLQKSMHDVSMVFTENTVYKISPLYDNTHAEMSQSDLKHVYKYFMK